MPLALELLLLCLIALLGAGCVSNRVIYADDFATLANWRTELEQGGRVEASSGAMEIDVPAGATVWFLPELQGPIEITYEATMIQAGGKNDRVSDLNCFWMATDARSPDDLFATTRSGAFADYNALRCYYASIGGNSNTTTRFRRYIGSPTTRPILPEHDRTEPLLEANVPVRIRIIADGSRIEFWGNDERLFATNDPQPYLRGRFAIRTVASHIRVRDFRVRRIR